MSKNGKRPVKKVDSDTERPDSVKKGDSKTKGQSGGRKMMVSPLNGAMTPVGGTLGNRGGGRKPDAVRAALANIAADKSGFVRDVIDGNVMQKIRIPASTLSKYFTCECGELKVVGDDPHVDVEVDASASVDSRLRAYDTAARYGIGQLKEVSVEHVRERVRQTLDIIRAHVAPDQAEAIVGELKAVWS